MPFLHFVHRYSLLSDKNILPCLFVLCYNIHGFNTVSHRVRDLQIGCSVALFLYRLTDSIQSNKRTIKQIKKDSIQLS